MLLRRSAFLKVGKPSERMIMRLTEDEATFIMGFKPTKENPCKVRIECQHGLLRVSAGKVGDDNSFSTWERAGKGGKFWECQLHTRLFPNVRRASYEDGLTEVVARKNTQTKELHAMLDQLQEGEEQTPSLMRGPGGRVLSEEEQTRRRAKQAETAATKTPSKPAAKPTTPAKTEAIQGSLLAPLDGTLVQQITDRFGIADAERTVLRSAVDMLNAQIRRGGGSIRAQVDPASGEIKLQVAKVQVTMEEI